MLAAERICANETLGDSMPALCRREAVETEAHPEPRDSVDIQTERDGWSDRDSFTGAMVICVWLVDSLMG